MVGLRTNWQAQAAHAHGPKYACYSLLVSCLTGGLSAQPVYLISYHSVGYIGHFHESGTYYWPDPDILSPRAPAAAAHAG